MYQSRKTSDPGQGGAGGQGAGPAPSAGQYAQENGNSQQRGFYPKTRHPNSTPYTVYVTNLDSRVVEADLEKFFGQFGPVNVSAMKQKDSKIYAFLNFDNNDHAKLAVERAAGQEFFGRKLYVDWSSKDGTTGTGFGRDSKPGYDASRTSKSRPDRDYRQRDSSKPSGDYDGGREPRESKREESRNPRESVRAKRRNGSEDDARDNSRSRDRSRERRIDRDSRKRRHDSRSRSPDNRGGKKSKRDNTEKYDTKYLLSMITSGKKHFPSGTYETEVEKRLQNMLKHKY